MRRYLQSCICILTPLINGCGQYAVIKGDRIERKSEYSIGRPPDKWRDVSQHNFYGGHGTQHYTQVQFVFFHCPDKQGILLEDVYFPTQPTLQKMKKFVPLETNPNSFEGLASYYLESRYSLSIGTASSSDLSRISFSTSSISGNKLADITYKVKKLGVPSCNMDNKVVSSYLERFIIIDMPFRESYWNRPRFVVLSYRSREAVYKEHLSDFEKWIATFKVE
jgi:hypothetical protein